MDFHLGAGDLMEEERRAPRINQFTTVIDAHSRLAVDEINLFGVVPVERAGDFWICANGVATEHVPILADGTPYIFADDFGGNVG